MATKRQFTGYRYKVEVHDSMEVIYLSDENKMNDGATKLIKRGDVFNDVQVFNAPDDMIDIYLSNGDIIASTEASNYKIRKTK
jgi:hypothetical protein